LEWQRPSAWNGMNVDEESPLRSGFKDESRMPNALPDPNERILLFKQRPDGEWALDGIEILRRK
jgi:hypothetical protein